MLRMVLGMVCLLAASTASADDWIDFIQNETLDTQFAEAKGMPGNLETATTTKDGIYVASGNLLFQPPKTWVAGAESETTADHTYGVTLLATNVQHNGQVDTGGDPQANPVRSGRATSRGQITSERVLVALKSGIANGHLSVGANPALCDIEGGYTVEAYVSNITIGGTETGIAAIWATYDATLGKWLIQWIDEDGWDTRVSSSLVKVVSFSHQFYPGDRLAFEGSINPDATKGFYDESLGSPTDRNPEAHVTFTADTELE